MILAPFLPSMSSLRAFEAAARHLSFTRAATELNLTQGAISQGIRTLEDMLGVQLFIREGTSIRLTDVGREYLESARIALTEVLVATDRATGRQSGGILTIACLGTFALKCLIPNLKDFRQRYPEISLRVRTLFPYETLAKQDYDVAIQYGTGDWPGLTVTKIVPEEVFPVCSPQLAKSGKGLRKPADLANFTIIKTASPFILRDDWPLWLGIAGVPDLKFSDEISFDLLYPSYQAAIEGLGVAMGRTAVVEKDIRDGKLIEPFSVRLGSLIGYYAVTTPDRARLKKVETFTNWLKERFAHI